MKTDKIKLPKSTRIDQQKQTKTRFYKEDDAEFKVVAKLRYDDSCNNGHNTFAITMDTYIKKGNGQFYDYCGGCDHDGVQKHFPELAKYIKWHLVSSDEPMHYLANTLYLAGEKDCNGKYKGEPTHFDHFIQFGDFPIHYEVKRDFWDWLRKVTNSKMIEIMEIEHGKDEDGYKYKPKFSFWGWIDGKRIAYCKEWYQCPFDYEGEAALFLEALQTYKVEFIKKATEYSGGKEPELESARRSAIWEGATLKQLQSKEALIARLPALMEEFKADIIELGFKY